MKLLFLSFSILLLSAAACKPAPPTSTPLDTSAVVLFAVGQLQSAGNNLKVGSLLKEGQMLRTGPKSVGDIQYRDASAGITVRLRENTEYTVNARQFKGHTTFSGKLTKGTVLFQSMKNDQTESFRIVAPTAVASVRGTRFEISVDEQQKATITVFDGKVSVRKRLPQIEDLAPEIIESSATLRGLVDEMEKKAVPMESGNTIQVERIPDAELPKIDLDALVKSATGQPMNAPVTPEQARKAAESIDRAMSDAARADGLRQAAAIPAPTVSPVRQTPEQMKQKLKEYEELVAVAREVLSKDAGIDEALRKRNAEKREQLESRIEQVFEKSAETLVLKDGRRIRGVILEEGGNYIALTVDGRVEVPKDSVESVEF